MLSAGHILCFQCLKKHPPEAHVPNALRRACFMFFYAIKNTRRKITFRPLFPIVYFDGMKAGRHAPLRLLEGVEKGQEICPSESIRNVSLRRAYFLSLTRSLKKRTGANNPGSL